MAETWFIREEDRDIEVPAETIPELIRQRRIKHSTLVSETAEGRFKKARIYAHRPLFRDVCAMSDEAKAFFDKKASHKDTVQVVGHQHKSTHRTSRKVVFLIVLGAVVVSAYLLLVVF